MLRNVFITAVDTVIEQSLAYMNAVPSSIMVALFIMAFEKLSFDSFIHNSHILYYIILITLQPDPYKHPLSDVLKPHIALFHVCNPSH
jgi:hypothetical protein